MEQTVLLTGGSGFIGSHVCRVLRERGVQVRVMARRPVGGQQVVRGDLADTGSLRGVCEGITTLVHAASAISADPVRCRVVNELGTAALVAEAQRAGVARIVYLGTAAVYGNGVHRCLVEDAVTPAPVSPTSRSRLVAEQVVRAAGGTVLRPLFVYGAGDRWFVPVLSRIAARVGARIEGGQARLSVISVHALAEAVCALVACPTDELAGAVLHAAHPEPVVMAELLAVLSEHALAPALTRDVSYAEAASAWDDSAGRLSLVSFDHFYDSSRLWGAVGPLHGAGFREAFPRYVDWYRAFSRPADPRDRVGRPGEGGVRVQEDSHAVQGLDRAGGYDGRAGGGWPGIRPFPRGEAEQQVRRGDAGRTATEATGGGTHDDVQAHVSA